MQFNISSLSPFVHDMQKLFIFYSILYYFNIIFHCQTKKRSFLDKNFYGTEWFNLHIKYINPAESTTNFNPNHINKYKSPCAIILCFLVFISFQMSYIIPLDIICIVFYTHNFNCTSFF